MASILWAEYKTLVLGFFVSLWEAYINGVQIKFGPMFYFVDKITQGCYFLFIFYTFYKMIWMEGYGYEFSWTICHVSCIITFIGWTCLVAIVKGRIVFWAQLGPKINKWSIYVTKLIERLWDFEWPIYPSNFQVRLL